jgi:hypothetical protein
MPVAVEEEQQRPAGLTERQVAELVQDDDVEAAELGGQGSGLAQAGFLLEAVH